jgi:5'-methylthioadenosine phosphorylase
LEICYLNVSLITDYDAGLEGEDMAPVSHETVVKIFNENNEKIKKLLISLIEQIPEKHDCTCHHALKTARLE